MSSLPQIDPKAELSSQSQEKPTYEMPQLRRWGSVEVITQVGNTTPGEDTYPLGFFGGSVYPSGLD